MQSKLFGKILIAAGMVFICVLVCESVSAQQRDRIENRYDRRENVRDRKENKRDRRENRRDRKH